MFFNPFIKYIHRRKKNVDGVKDPFFWAFMNGNCNNFKFCPCVLLWTWVKLLQENKSSFQGLLFAHLTISKAAEAARVYRPEYCDDHD